MLGIRIKEDCFEFWRQIKIHPKILKSWEFFLIEFKRTLRDIAALLKALNKFSQPVFEFLVNYNIIYDIKLYQQVN